jgi:putative ABC transport system permease protein
MLMRLLRRAVYLFRRDRHARDLAEEMAFHRSLSGAPAFGNATLAREDAREVWSWRWADDAWQDVRYTVRSMLRQPGFAAAAIGIIALGTGATTCVFGLLDSLVMRSLPVERADRLVRLRDPSFSYPIFTEVRDNLPVLDGVFAWNIDRAYVDWTGAGDLLSTDVFEATGELFTTLRVTPVIGRTFDANDTTAAVISHAAWTRRFGADPAVIGRAVRVGDKSYTVVGVTPADFFGVAPGLAPEVTVLLASRHSAGDLAAPGQAWLHVMGRLKDGIRIEEADAVLQTVWPGIMESTTNPGMPADRRARYLARKTGLESGRAGFSRVRNQFGEPLRLLMALVTLLLAIACASVANLLLARGAARRKEIAVRLAIGAKRARIFRQLLTEALVLTLAGAGIGLLLASWAGGLLVAFLTTTSERLTLDTSPGWRLAGFAVGLAVAVSAISALLPSLTATRADVTGALKETGQPGAGLLRRWSAGKILVAVQVALALVLLAGAAVFGRSLARVLAQDTGMDTGRVLVVLPDAQAAGYEGAALREFHTRMLARLRETPGVESAALSLMPPISNTMGNWTQSISVDGVELPPTEARYVYFNAVSPRYFETVGMALRRGRDIADTDTARSPRIVIVNESLARRFFAGRTPIGHRISIGKAASRNDLEIVGVVQDAKYRTLQEPARSIGYLPVAHLDGEGSDTNLVAEVRAASLPIAGPAVRRAMRDLDPRVPVSIESVGARIRESTINERVIAVLTAALGIAALVLAGAGLYGLFAYAVSRHGREIGLRMALGARPASVLWMVQRESLALAALGIAAGLGSAIALGRFIRAMLFEVTPGDPVALAAASAVVLAVAAGAAYLPARRAASVDPVVALKRDC